MKLRSGGRNRIIELQDLDAMTDMKEVLEALKREQKSSNFEAKVLGSKRIYGSGQSTIVLVQLDVATSLLTTSKLRVGLVYG